MEGLLLVRETGLVCGVHQRRRPAQAVMFLCFADRGVYALGLARRFFATYFRPAHKLSKTVELKISPRYGGLMCWCEKQDLNVVYASAAVPRRQ